MDKAYNPVPWQNAPSTATPVGATNLLRMGNAINTIDDRVIVLDTAKANLSTVNAMVKDVVLNQSNGVITVLYQNGTTTTYDTKLEKIAINFYLDAANQRLVVVLDDGTEQYIDFSDLITQYEFENSATIGMTVTGGKVKADLSDGAVTPEKLQPNYLADITTQANIATTQAGVATDAAEDALTYRDAALAAKTAAELARDQAVDISNVGIAGPNKLGLTNGNGNAVPDSLGAVWVDSNKDKATLTGSSVQFTTADDALIALSVKCKSTQTVTTQGKQLFDKAKVGTVKYINPTTGALTTSTYNNNVSALIAVTAGQSYTISGHTFVQPNTPVGIAWYGPTGTYISGTSYQNATGNGTYTAPAGAAYVRYTCNNADLNTSQMEIGTVATSYAAFVPTSPSLDYPAPITSTGDGGSFVAGACAKNQASNVSYPAVAQFLDSVLSQFDGIKPDTTYTISLIIPTGEQYYPNENLFVSALPLPVGDGTRKSITVTTKSSVSFSNSSQYVSGTSRWRILKNYTGHSSSGTASQLQIELGTTSTPYEAYKGNTITVNSGGYSTPDGTADNIGTDTKKKTANCAKIVLNGTESGWGLSATNTNTLAFDISALTNGLATDNNKIVCDKLKVTVTTDSTDTEHIRSSLSAYPTLLRLFINKARLSTQDVAGLKTYLASNPITVIYATSTSVTTDITATPSNYLTSYKGITNVFTTDATQPTLTAVSKSELWARDYLQDVALADISTNKVAKGELFINVKDYGAVGNGIADDGVKINNAIDACATSGGGTVLIPRGTYATSITIIVKPTVKLLLTKGTTIKSLADVNVIRIKPDSIFDAQGGLIDVSGVTSFSKASIYLDGTDQFGQLNSKISTMIESVRLFGNHTGSGFKMYCPVPNGTAKYIQMIKSLHLDIFFFNKGIELLCDSHSESVGSWINGNIFDDISIVGCGTSISINGHASPYECAGNSFTNLQIQPYYYYSTMAIQVDGAFNYFQGFVWDWNTDLQTIAFDINGNANKFNTNIQKLSANKINDKGYRTVIQSTIDSQSDIHYPSVVGGLTMNGEQDDYLVYAMKRFTVTSTVLPTGGILNNMFDPNGGYQCIWDATVTNPIIIEIDMTSAPIVALQNVGIAFLYGNNAQNIKIEAYYSGAYHTVGETTINHSNYYNLFLEGIGSVSKLKFTLSGGTASGIYVGRIFAQDSGQTGQRFLSMDGGKVLNDIDFKFNYTGVVLLDRVTGSRYRLKISNGTLGVEIV